MPELAEVEFFRRRWWEAGARATVRRAEVWAGSLVFRGLAGEFAGGAMGLANSLAGTHLLHSGTHGKQMWFVCKIDRVRRLWLGVHLGMTGSLRAEPSGYIPRKHDALVLRLPRQALVFHDPRQFGRVRAWAGKAGARPPWLRNLPAEILSAKFTPEFVRRVLTRHLRAPLKAVLLMQKYFPGVGNWMADEILWRAKLPPRLPAGRAGTPKIARTLTATIRRVTRDARRVIAGVDGKLPPDLNVHIPDSWLFNHRWKDGGLCPKTKAPLRREVIGGRTTCWSPAWQRGPK